MELYLVRHGETESNKEKRYQGWTESPLSQKGISQAEQAGLFLGSQNITGLYCSDLQRAMHTARIIGMGSGLKPEVTNLLREIHFGDWEGHTYDEIEAGWGNAIRLWLDDPFNKAAPGGESLGDVCGRMKHFLDHLTDRAAEGQRIAAVSHGGSIRALLYHVLNLDTSKFWKIKVDNASISLIRKEGSPFKVVYYNRTDHLNAGKGREEAVGSD